MNYTLKFRFYTAKAGRRKGEVLGSGGSGECDITTDFSLEELKNKLEDLKSLAYHSIKDNSTVKKMGSILNIDITDVVVGKP